MTNGTTALIEQLRMRCEYGDAGLFRPWPQALTNVCRNKIHSATRFACPTTSMAPPASPHTTAARHVLNTEREVRTSAWHPLAPIASTRPWAGSRRVWVQLSWALLTRLKNTGQQRWHRGLSKHRNTVSVSSHEKRTIIRRHNNIIMVVITHLWRSTGREGAQYVQGSAQNSFVFLLYIIRGVVV